MATLGDDGAFVDDGFAKDHDLTVGSTVPRHLRHRARPETSR